MIRRLKALRKTSIDRVAAVVTIVSALVGLAAAMIGLFIRYEEPLSELKRVLLSNNIVLYIWDYRYPIFLSSLFIFLLVLYFLHTRKINRLTRHIRSWHKIIERIYVAERTHLEIEKKVLSHLAADEVDAAKAAINSGLKTSCTNLARIFSDYTGHNCHACLKKYDPGTSMVETLVRDNPVGLYPRYDHAPLEYPVNDNTALFTIVTLNEEFYCSNDLNKERNYTNHNKDWPKYYDATLVIPFPPSRGTRDSDTRGFLCIDNFDGGFDPQVGRSILALFATFYYHILETYRDKTGSYI